MISGAPAAGKTALAEWFAETEGQIFPGGVWREDFAELSDTATPSQWKRFAYDVIRHLAEELDGQRALLLLDEDPKPVDQIWASHDIPSAWDQVPATTMALSAIARLAPQLSCIMTCPSDPWESLFVGQRPFIGQRGRYSLPGATWLGLPLRSVSRREISNAIVDETQGSMYAVRKLVKRTGGDVEVASAVLGLARRGEAADLVLERFEPVVLPGLVDTNGNPITDPNADVIGVGEFYLSDVKVRLTDRLLSRPDLMRSLTPRQFEEFVAELYADSGFEVELTPASNDGGFDILARQRTPFGKMVTLIECKRYAPSRPVKINLVRELYGVVEAAGAHAGVLATTASFTRGSKAFAETHKRIHLQDYFALQDMLLAGGR